MEADGDDGDRRIEREHQPLRPCQARETAAPGRGRNPGFRRDLFTSAYPQGYFAARLGGFDDEGAHEIHFSTRITPIGVALRCAETERRWEISTRFFA